MKNWLEELNSKGKKLRMITNRKMKNLLEILSIKESKLKPNSRIR